MPSPRRKRRESLKAFHGVRTPTVAQSMVELRTVGSRRGTQVALPSPAFASVAEALAFMGRLGDQGPSQPANSQAAFDARIAAMNIAQIRRGIREGELDVLEVLASERRGQNRPQVLALAAPL